MGLPAIGPVAGEVELPGGQKVSLKGLSRSEAMAASEYGEDGAALECYLIATSTGESPDATREWYEATPSEVVQTLVDAILELNGMGGDLGKASSGA